MPRLRGSLFLHCGRTVCELHHSAPVNSAHQPLMRLRKPAELQNHIDDCETMRRIETFHRPKQQSSGFALLDCITLR